MPMKNKVCDGNKKQQRKNMEKNKISGKIKNNDLSLAYQEAVQHALLCR